MLALPVGIGGVSSIGIHDEAAFGCHLRVELLKAARCGVAFVGKRFFTLSCLLGIQTVEGTLWHQHFSAYIENMRKGETGGSKQILDGCRGRLQTLRNIDDGTDVLYHRLALNLVPACNGIGKHTVGIDERDGQTVVFRFVGVRNLLARKRSLQLTCGCGEPLLQFFVAINILDTLHRDDVTVLLEASLNVGADTLGRTAFKHLSAFCL